MLDNLAMTEVKLGLLDLEESVELLRQTANVRGDVPVAYVESTFDS